MADCPISSVTEDHTERRKRGRRRNQIRQDESPNEAKRRRTQIRLAQRAYRSRKEAELQALKARVHELDMLVERMNETFLSFTDDLMKSGVLLTYPDVARRLHQTIAQSLSLTNRAVSVAEDDADPANAETNVPETKANAGVLDATEQDVANANDTHDVANVTLPDILESAVPAQREDSSQYPAQITQQSNLAVPEIPTQATPLYSTPSFLNTPSSSTYSLEGASFAHRLYRACVEQGHRCLTNPPYQLEELTYKFRLPLRVFTLHNIRAHLEEFLCGGHHGTRMELNIPFFSIGGAGTHFKHNQRSYDADNVSFQPSVIQVATERVDLDMRGDWFDCYDVEGYLEKCRIVPVRGLALPKMTFPAALPGLERGLRNQRVSGPSTSQQFGNQKIIDETILIECKSPLVDLIGYSNLWVFRKLNSVVSAKNLLRVSR
ncbi:hypothetical protein Asppvi_009028 [Aspergillus pseudoviridinutans]|uniref:BZIP domain-containing protein n=1 Tax=Aspergillus pseudoviridinutans TaxID=1517512 RepID=A0A9P3BH25_9EURO|nr:uncharacterized protein Asppvi_009028 [Aspergillus pseudoviridinutans]GIJ90079.1 hypothetical protein Asppvi_009028 [Aspergillus pseudoviridinutans]